MGEEKLHLSKEDTELSKKRTMLSAKRTLLSHVRTALVVLSLAFAFMKLEKEKPIDAFTIILFVLSGVFLIVGIIDYFVEKAQVEKL